MDRGTQIHSEGCCASIQALRGGGVASLHCLGPSSKYWAIERSRDGNSYGMNFESGTGTVTCYNWKDPPPGPPTPAPPSVQGRCGSNVYPAGNLSALGIDYDAAIPFAWFPKGNGNYGNCDDCGIKCSTYYSSNSYVYYNGAPLCYNITSKLTGITKTIRVNDAVWRVEQQRPLLGRRQTVSCEAVLVTRATKLGLAGHARGHCDDPVPRLAGASFHSGATRRRLPSCDNRMPGSSSASRSHN